jgi:uncharacterized protein (UPF0335 family)
MSDDVIASDARLRSYVERLERLDSDEDAIKADKKEVFAELKGDGYSPKIVRKLLRIRKQNKASRQEEASLIELYAAAVGEILP